MTATQTLTTHLAPHDRGRTGMIAAGEAIESALRIAEQDGSRIGRWRFMGELLDARKAFANHAGTCSSAGGPLGHIADQRPRLRSAIDRRMSDHHRILRELDNIIAAANGSGSAPMELLIRRARLVRSAIEAHRRAVSVVVFEWANRDIGGEGG